MNLQIIGDKSVKKVIAVAEDLMGQDPDGITLHVLQSIVSHCGLDDRYLVVPTSQLDAVCDRWTPFALVADEQPSEAAASHYCVCISDREEGVLPETVCHHTTYSLEDDRADFVAKNLRNFQGRGYTFDLVGLGIIGRIHLLSGDEQTLRSTLIAASAALSCGISFADVVEVLNTLAAMVARSGLAVQ